VSLEQLKVMSAIEKLRHGQARGGHVGACAARNAPYDHAYNTAQPALCPQVPKAADAKEGSPETRAL